MPEVHCVVGGGKVGLHPLAIHLVAEMARSVAQKHQVILATQSTVLLDQCMPEEVIVVEQEGGGTEFRRIEPEKLGAWLEEYSLSELWEKNVLGGRPR